MTSPLTLFTFGYWGWGTVTDKLVAAVDAVEAARGFAPPVFVDIRYNNRTRAPGFSGNAFRDLIGADRFHYMKKLGNRAIADRSLSAIKIDDPAAAKDLLDTALAAAKGRRRVIFFCACAHPVDPDKGRRCHRTTVANLVLREAQKRGLDAAISEWPGGEPIALELHVEGETLRKLAARLDDRAGAMNIPLGRRLPEPVLLGLPYGSVLVATHNRQSVAVLSGPATYAGAHWQLPALEVLEHTPDDLEGLLAAGYQRRKDWGREVVKIAEVRQR